MPLVHITLADSYSPALQSQIADRAHEALVEAIGVPPDDRFQVIRPLPTGGFRFDPQYFGVKRSGAPVLLEVSLRSGRADAKKRAFYAALARRLQPIGVRPGDIMVVLTENEPIDWSFGDGIAQGAPAEAAVSHSHA